MPELRKGSEEGDDDEHDTFVVEFHNGHDKFRAEEIAAKNRPIAISGSLVLVLTKEEYKEVVRLDIPHILHGDPPEPEAFPIRFATPKDELSGYQVMRECGNVSQTSTGVVFATPEQLRELGKYKITYTRLQLEQPELRKQANKSRSKQV